MIRITVELWPFGDASHKRTLASADIWNDASGDQRTGNYGFKLFGKDGRVLRAGALAKFRRVDFSVWWLIAACLRAAFPNVEKALRK